LQPAYANLGNSWQLNTFAAQAPVFDPVSSLFVIWLFPNDLFNYQATFGMTPGTAGGAAGFGPVGINELIGNGIQNIVDTVLFLASNGAQHFLVPNLVDIGKSPDGNGDPNLTAISQAFNFYLAQALTGLDTALTSAEIVQFDTFGTFNDLIANPGAYGITNTTDRCVEHIVDGLCNPYSNTWLFWDGSHPTTYAHSILGAEFRAAVPEPESILLLAIGLLGIFLTRRRAA
jgi:phospholipase/lecithinase/hemolysin